MIYGTQYRSHIPRTTPHERVSNLQVALETAHRLRGQRIYTGTIQHWESLLEEANRFLGETGPDDEKVRTLAVELEAIVAARRWAAGRPARPLLPA